MQKDSTMLIEIKTKADLELVLSKLKTSSIQSFEKIRQSEVNPLDWMREIKFNKIGYCPYDPTRALNFIEQLNQTWSLVAAIEATRILFDLHPEAGGFSIAAGAHAAQKYDVMALATNNIAVEIFAATSPNSNQKLTNDLEKLRLSDQDHRYVMFLSPNFPTTTRHQKLEKFGVQVWSVATN
jgi:hypothetical protein